MYGNGDGNNNHNNGSDKISKQMNKDDCLHHRDKNRQYDICDNQNDINVNNNNNDNYYFIAY